MPDLRDLEITDNGDLVVDENGDLKVASSLRTLEQEVMMRVRTNFRELRQHPTFGSDLQRLFGGRVSNKAADTAQQRVALALASGGRFKQHAYQVITMPLGREAIGVVVKLTPRLEDQIVEEQLIGFTLNFNEGTIEPVNV